MQNKADFVFQALKCPKNTKNPTSFNSSKTAVLSQWERQRQKHKLVKTREPQNSSSSDRRAAIDHLRRECKHFLTRLTS